MSSTSSVIRSRQAALGAELQSTLLESAFDNHFSLHPRRFAQIGTRLAELFVEYVDSMEPAAAFQEGRELAREGLGEKTVLRITSLMLRFCMKSFAAESALLLEHVQKADGYSAGLLEGFMKGREELILQDQEKMRLALTKAMESKGT